MVKKDTPADRKDLIMSKGKIIVFAIMLLNAAISIGTEYILPFLSLKIISILILIVSGIICIYLYYLMSLNILASIIIGLACMLSIMGFFAGFFIFIQVKRFQSGNDVIFKKSTDYTPHL